MNIKFGVFWKQNLGTIYKDNSITTLGKEADVDLNLSEVSSIHANFKVDGKNYTSIVYIVDIEKGLIRIPFTREVLSIGMHELELVAVMKNGDVIPSQTFTYNIVESLDNLEDITEETNYPILIQLLQDVNSKIAEIDDAIARIPSPEELKGEKGDKGDKGEQGIQGERGLQGIQGIRGEKGDKGDRGLQGIQGVKGEKGDKGERGERGLQGIQGNQGARGIQGEKGDKGETGVGLGFEWSGTKLGIKKDTDISYTYVELKGDKGEQGAKGEKGDTPSISHLEKQVSDKSKELDKKFNTLTAKQQQDAEVVTARDGEVSLHTRLERDLAKGKIHFVDVEGSSVSAESEEGYLENVEIHGNTWQDANNLSDIRSVGTKVEGQELYEIDVVSCGKNLFDGNIIKGFIGSAGILDTNATDKDFRGDKYILCKPNTNYKGAYYVEDKRVTSLKLHFFDKDYKKISHKSGYEDTLSPENAKYIMPSLYTSDLIKGIVIVENENAPNQYEPYQEDKLTILSPTPLEKVGDVADRIICKDGVWGVEKNNDEIRLDEQVFGTNDTSVVIGEYVKAPIAYSKCSLDNSLIEQGYCITTFGTGLNGSEWNSPTKEGIYIGKNAFGIVVKIETIGGNTKTHIKNYFLNKNHKFKRSVATPTFIPLPHDQQVKLRTFADRTNISFLTEIEGTIKAQVPKSLGATVNTHTTQIDNLNKELDRVKKLEESTVSTVTSSKALTTIAETSNGYFEDVKIEGKTLVNKFMCGLEEGIYNSNTGEKYNILKYIRSKDKIAINDSKFTFESDFPLMFYFYTDTEYISHLNTKATYGVIDIPNGVKYITFRSVDEYSNFGAKVLILEGDHTDKDLSYFEGLKSVGQGVDEISVSSVNENLYPTDSINIDFDANSEISIPANIKLKPNTEYCLNANTNFNTRNYIYLNSSEVKLDTFTHNGFYNYTRANGVSYQSVRLPFRFMTDNNNIYFTYISDNNGGTEKDKVLTDITLTSCTTPIEYQPHQSNKKQILYYNPNTQTWEKPVLREWDSIEKHNDGKYYYHKRSGEVVLNGSENWFKYMANHEMDSSCFQLNIVGKKHGYGVSMCDRFTNTCNSEPFSLTGVKEFTYTDHPSLNTIYMNYGKDNSTSLVEWKAWLQTNPTTVVYQLAKEEVFECTNLDLITYNGETNLIVNSGAIQPKLELKVLSNVSNVVKLLQEKVSVLENKFIEGLKQVLAGDMLSLAHLLYPEDFENNHEIQTLEL